MERPLLRLDPSRFPSTLLFVSPPTSYSRGCTGGTQAIFVRNCGGADRNGTHDRSIKTAVSRPTPCGCPVYPAPLLTFPSISTGIQNPFHSRERWHCTHGRGVGCSSCCGKRFLIHHGHPVATYRLLQNSFRDSRRLSCPHHLWHMVRWGKPPAA